MIRIEIAEEPESFREKVREPGENVLALLEGRPAPHRRRGRPITTTKRSGTATVKKTVDDFPYWQKCLDDLYDKYHGICAYYCFYIERAALPHVDHFVAKCGEGAGRAYEWDNYRLACGYANTCKREHPDVLDPAEIQDGWFQLDLDTLDVRANPELPAPRRAEVEATIVRLKLREDRALAVRRRAMARFREGLSLDFLHHDHPFLARELVRQGVLTSAALTALPAEVVNAVEPELA